MEIFEEGRVGAFETLPIIKLLTDHATLFF